jgi:hypothetical protein
MCVVCKDQKHLKTIFNPKDILRHRWEVKVNIDVNEVRNEAVDRIQVAWDTIQWSALVNMILKL